MRAILAIPLVSVLALVFACGNSGDGGAQDGQAPGVDPGTINDNPKNITGSFFFENTDNPAAGIDLLLADWSAISLKPFTTASDGSVTIDLSEFVEGRTYSFHLIKGDLKIADIDLSALNTGLQSGFEYRGGYGFALGDVIIPKDNRGVIAEVTDGLVASLGGGFSLSASSSLKLEDFTVPDLVSSFRVRPSFVVSNARDLFYGLLMPVDILETERVYSKYRAISIQLTATSEDAVARVFLSRDVDWREASLLLPNEFSESAAAVSWKTSEYYLNQSGTLFYADILTRNSLVNRVIYFKIEGEEPPQYELIRVTTSGYSLPPIVKAISLAGATPQAIDFSDAALENGLTTPFCHLSGDVVMDITPPRDLNGGTVTGSVLSQIELSTEYYSLKAGSVTLIPSSAALANPYDADIGDTDSGSFTWSWSALKKAMLFKISPSSLTASSHTVTLPAKLFPDSYGGQDVTRIKVKVMFKDENHPGKSGSVFWIRKGC